ncbi:MAG: alpha-glucoside transport system substrate-binding protein [Verrucomicrobiales bacterium]|jgi:alpha-glucoside transport system substrate-binding protein
MISKWMKLLAALFAVSLVAAACGSDAPSGAVAAVTDDGAAAASLEQAQDAATAAQADADQAKADLEAAQADLEAATTGVEAPVVREFEGQVVQITGPERSAEEWNAIETAMEPFEEETGLSVIYTGSADWEAEINVQIAAGNPPDISIFPQPGKLADFAREGFVNALPGDVFDSVSANWQEAQMGFGLVDGEFYGVPVKNDLKSIVWHKPAVFEANGYEIPTTWDDLKALTNTMIDDGVTPWCVGIESGQATGWVFTDWTEDLMLRFHGGDAYDQWVSNELKFSSDEVTQVMQEIIDLWSTDGAVFGGIESIASTHFASKPAEDLIADNCAMVRQASFFASFLPEGSSVDVDVFYFPSLTADDKPVMGGGNLTGAFNTNDATWAVMDYMGSGEYANRRQAAQKAAKGGDGVLSGFNTANLNADKSLWEPLGQGFVTILQEAPVFRFDGSDLMPADVGAGEFWTQATAMVNGEIDVAGGAAKIDEAWPTE